MNNIKTFENYEESNIGGWAKVDGYINIPVGDWLVQLEKESMFNIIHTAHITENMCTIGGQFAWDMPKVIAYMPLPNPLV